MSVNHSYSLGDMSPSLLYNNLSSTTGDGACYYASGTHVCCARSTTGQAQPVLQMNNAVLSVRVVTLGGRLATQPLILVATSVQCLLYCGNQSVTGFDELYANGGFAGCCDIKVCHVSRGDVAHMTVGSTTGGVVYAEATPNAAAVGNMTVSKSPMQRSHDGARVTAVTTGTPSAPRELAAVTGDAQGRVILWASGVQGTAPSPYAMIPSAHETDCVTSLAIVTTETAMSIDSPNVAVAVAYGCGKVRLYGVAGDLRVEICAHSQWINAIQYSPVSQMLATVGEDSVIEVFSARAAVSAEPVKLIASSQMTNALPTGVDFSATGRSVIVAAFNVPFLGRLDF